MIEFYPIKLYNWWDDRFIVCQNKAHRDAAGPGWFKTKEEAMQAHLLAEQALIAASIQIVAEQRPRRRDN